MRCNIWSNYGWPVRPAQRAQVRELPSLRSSFSLLLSDAKSGTKKKRFIPAGYGDLIAGVLAIIATVAMAETAAWAIWPVWIFNVWGAADLLFAFYKGARVGLEPGSLAATFYIVTAVVPPLLVSHVMIFMLLMRTGV